ncbi:MAG: hypothetical protein JO130_07660 [Solirubrobacterales bacterium]|nr:hypothetical protein [Solirubrobacterales bacterium]
MSAGMAPGAASSGIFFFVFAMLLATLTPIRPRLVGRHRLVEELAHSASFFLLLADPG